MRPKRSYFEILFLHVGIFPTIPTVLFILVYDIHNRQKLRLKFMMSRHCTVHAQWSHLVVKHGRNDLKFGM